MTVLRATLTCPHCGHERSETMPTNACVRSEEHTSELQSRLHLVCRLLLEKKKNKQAVTPHYQPQQVQALLRPMIHPVHALDAYAASEPDKRLPRSHRAADGFVRPRAPMSS